MLFLDNEGQVSQSPPMISFLDHGFLFGDSLYEVVRAYNRKVLGWDEHMQRMTAGGRRVAIDVEKLLPDLKVRTQKLLAALQEPDAALRIIVSRGVGKLHIDPRTCVQPSIYMAAWKYEAANFTKPQRLLVPKILRNDIRTTDPAIKSGNYLNSVLAYKEALDAGYDDAILLNPQGEVTELPTSNIGWVTKKGVAVTPTTESGILHGITRGLLIQAASIKEGFYTEQDLKAAAEIFVISTFKNVLTVSEVRFSDGEVKKFQEGPVTKSLHQKLAGFINTRLSSQTAWF